MVPALLYPGLYTAPPVVLPAIQPPPDILTTTLPTPAYGGLLYPTTAIAVQFGVLPLVFGLLVPGPPPGITLSDAGVISGTPPLLAQIGPTALPGALVDTFYSQQLSVVALPATTYAFTVRVLDLFGQSDDQAYSIELIPWAEPTTYALLSGALPGCVSFAPNGTIAGPPMRVGTFPLTIQATSAVGQVITRTINFTVTS